MSRLHVWIPLAVAVLALLSAGPMAAQTGTVAGRVIDAETGEPLASAVVQALDAGGEVGGATTDAGGRFRLSVPPGAYSIVVTLLGYDVRRLELDVATDETETVTVALISRALRLNPIVVTASRREEKALDSPAHVAVIGTEEIRERPASTAVEHVKGQPGVDVSQTGLQQANVVTRGFNNVFSGSLLVLTDNRYAHVPSLRVNAYNFIPLNNHDLERIEILLGPGAALYGPNAASGVMHMITTSPIDDPGTSFSVTGGERSLFMGEFRHATSWGERYGLKVSGLYFRGDDWEFTDPSEAAAREEALQEDPETRVGLRDFDAERWAADLRFDARPWDDGEIILSAGMNTALSSIELTGIGAGQADDWTYSYLQGRLNKGRLFAQVFGNFSDAGDTFLLRTGQPIVDNSLMVAGQVQHGFALGERHDFIYGLDVQRTVPRTEETITGRNEDDDEIDEIGGYLHSETRLAEALDFIGALRIDDHSELDDPVFSPRAALVVKPAENQNVRVTYNRAFSTPTTNNLFLDIVAGRIPLGPGVGFDLRTRGTPTTGFTWNDRCPGGTMDGLCMRSPFVPGQQLPANAALAWNALLEAVAPPSVQPLLPALESEMPPVETVLRRFNQQERTFVPDPSGPREIMQIDPTITQTFELGYKGVLADRVVLAADVYRSDVDDFIGPLRTETPSVFLDPQSTAAFIQQRLAPLVQAGQLSPEELAAITQQLTEGLSMVPIGTVAPDQSDSSDIILAYRNFGSIDLWGADLAVEVLLGDRFTVGGTFSYVSEECLDFDDDGSCLNALDVALNAPRTKGSLSLRYDDQTRGLTLSTRARFTEGFPMNSGVFIGEVDGFTVVDANAVWRPSALPGTSIALQALNLFDEEHREFVGAPEIGRLIMLRLSYDVP